MIRKYYVEKLFVPNLPLFSKSDKPKISFFKVNILFDKPTVQIIFFIQVSTFTYKMLERHSRKLEMEIFLRICQFTLFINKFFFKSNRRPVYWMRRCWLNICIIIFLLSYKQRIQTISSCYIGKLFVTILHFHFFRNLKNHKFHVCK